MTTVLLFHHAQGLTPGVRAFADALRAAGHMVHVPDLYDGRTFQELEAGVAYAETVGFPEIIRRGTEAADALPAEIVYAGFSLGVLPAQSLAQTRPGAKGALLVSSCIPLSEFGGAWSDGLPLQIHAMAADALADLEIAAAVANEVPTADLFLYPGSAHLFADSSLDAYDAEAAALLTERTLAFLQRVG